MRNTGRREGQANEKIDGQNAQADAQSERADNSGTQDKNASEKN